MEGTTMTAAALAMQRIHPRMAIVIALLLAAAVAVAVIVTALHGVPTGGHQAMFHGGQPGATKAVLTGCSMFHGSCT
jgi:hypothetical protein